MHGYQPCRAHTFPNLKPNLHLSSPKTTVTTHQPMVNPLVLATSMTSGGGGPISEVPKPPRGKLSWRSKTSGDCSWEISWYRNLMKFMLCPSKLQCPKSSGIPDWYHFFSGVFSGWQMMWGDMTSFPKTSRWCKPLLLYLLFGFGDILICPDMPNFYIFHYYLWLWGSPHSKMQMPLLRKLRWRAHRCVPSPQKFGNSRCFTSESTRRWVDLRPKPQSYFELYIICIYI